MRLCTYTVTHDHGLAPNPFWGYCTLGLCTPNYQNIRLAPGDWLIGFTGQERGKRLLYAMQLSEQLDFEDYFDNPRFHRKKPVSGGSWKQLCGDNIYYRDEGGEWQRLPSIFHRRAWKQEQDLRNHFVFIAEHYYYFGKNAVELRAEFEDLVIGRGVKCSHDAALTAGLLDWLQAKHEPGVHGEPHDIVGREDDDMCGACT